MTKIIDLKNKKCVACEGGVPPLTKDEALKLHEQTPDWTLADDSKSISRNYKFKDFVEAMKFINQVAELAESEGHHPDIEISYNKLKLSFTTHAIGGLSENDFILAAKIDLIS